MSKCKRPQWGAHEGGPSSYDLCECGHNNYWHSTAGCNHPDCLDTPKKTKARIINPYKRLGVGSRLSVQTVNEESV